LVISEAQQCVLGAPHFNDGGQVDNGEVLSATLDF
jgi:hypothetical protein